MYLNIAFLPHPIEKMLWNDENISLFITTHCTQIGTFYKIFCKKNTLQHPNPLTQAPVVEFIWKGWERLCFPIGTGELLENSWK